MNEISWIFISLWFLILMMIFMSFSFNFLNSFKTINLKIFSFTLII